MGEKQEEPGCWGWEVEEVEVGATRAYRDQVGGRRLVLELRATGDVLKAANPAEQAFYARAAAAFRPFTPAVYGAVLLRRNAAQSHPYAGQTDAQPDRETPSPPQAPRPPALLRSPRHLLWANSRSYKKSFFGELESRVCLRLENLCRGMDLPCVLDLKSGLGECYPDAPPEKRVIKAVKNGDTTSASLGIRLSMVQRWLPRQGLYEFTAAKSYGFQLDDAGLVRAVEAFAGRRAGVFAAQAQRLLRLLEGPAGCGWRFYTASLLLLYDAAEPRALGPADRASSARLCLVDFAHSLTPDAGLHGPHHSFLFGLRNLVRILRREPLLYNSPTSSLSLNLD